MPAGRVGSFSGPAKVADVLTVSFPSSSTYVGPSLSSGVFTVGLSEALESAGGTEVDIDGEPRAFSSDVFCASFLRFGDMFERDDAPWRGGSIEFLVRTALIDSCTSRPRLGMGVV